MPDLNLFAIFEPGLYTFGTIKQFCNVYFGGDNNMQLKYQISNVDNYFGNTRLTWNKHVFFHTTLNLKKKSKKSFFIFP